MSLISKSIGMIEFRSISKGIQISNEIIKKHIVEILYLKSICPGKFLIIVCGDVDQVNRAIDYGVNASENFIVDSFIINSVDLQIIDALKNRYKRLECINAISVVETNKVCSGIKMLDKALKSGDVNLIKLQLSFSIGGKLVYILSSDISNLEYALEESKKTVNEKNIVHSCVIASVDEQIVENLIK